LIIEARIKCFNNYFYKRDKTIKNTEAKEITSYIYILFFLKFHKGGTMNQEKGVRDWAIVLKKLEEKLEEAHKKAGNLTGKFELELANMRSMLDDKIQEAKILKEQLSEFQGKKDDLKQKEEKFLNELQQIRDEKIKLDSDLEEKNKEVIELKKKIKMMRRDLQKS